MLSVLDMLNGSGGGRDGDELVGGVDLHLCAWRRRAVDGGEEEAPLGAPFEQQGLGYLVGGHAPGPGQVLHGLHGCLRRRHRR